ncbi:hypothetical protein AXG93_3096s1180 [Marchantia polymorpha subsp. ruderalis]|uniref:Uncharacterized protein n=1 Tax=Marchantia polymorpha subsp. ruderalis TaxID=1480154 RepID=A0A176W734_MARPO|nr:hypothetical protein AXG93_3096s1180 [Marchantia polymorpha subsp. ruderalis]
MYDLNAMPGTTDSSLDTTFANLLRTLCPSDESQTFVRELDATNGTFDNEYFKVVKSQRGLTVPIRCCPHQHPFPLQGETSSDVRQEIEKSAKVCPLGKVPSEQFAATVGKTVTERPPTFQSLGARPKMFRLKAGEGCGLIRRSKALTQSLRLGLIFSFFAFYQQPSSGTSEGRHSEGHLSSVPASCTPTAIQLSKIAEAAMLPYCILHCPLFSYFCVVPSSYCDDEYSPSSSTLSSGKVEFDRGEGP